MKSIESDDHLVVLHREVIESVGLTCSQCGCAPSELFVFVTMRGLRRRVHKGAFCGLHCHDVFHGLKPQLNKEINQ